MRAAWGDRSGDPAELAISSFMEIRETCPDRGRPTGSRRFLSTCPQLFIRMGREMGAAAVSEPSPSRTFPARILQLKP